MRQPARLTASWALGRPWGSGRLYPDSPDPELDDGASAYHGANVTRRREIERAYDPDRVFGFPQSL